MLVARILLGIASVLVIAATILPIIQTHHWWIRAWDFPRLQLGILAFVLALAGFLIFKSVLNLMPLILLACTVWQAWHVLPFTSFYDVEVPFVEHDGRDPVTFISANVLMHNRDYDRFTTLVDREDPDVLFVMENDEKWTSALEPVLSRYSHVTAEPKDNLYGLVFATRLEVLSSKVVYLSDHDTPAFLARLKNTDGFEFFFIGLHPKPPTPGVSTEERDKELKRSATLSGQKDVPVIAIGDFNVPAWSNIAYAFKRYGDFLDPRVGRKIMPSFDAQHPVMRFPIDQLYVTDGVDLLDFGRLEAFGSDHFPLFAELAFRERSNAVADEKRDH